MNYEHPWMPEGWSARPGENMPWWESLCWEVLPWVIVIGLVWSIWEWLI